MRALSLPLFLFILAEVEELFSGNYGALLEIMQEMLTKTPVSRPYAGVALDRFEIYYQYGVGW